MTLNCLKGHLKDENIVFLICDDGSTDGTSKFLQKNYPTIILVRNERSRGLIFSRNKLMGLVSTPYAISLDDDAHFITSDFLPKVENYFLKYPECGVIAFRIFWGKSEPTSTQTVENAQQVRNFVGCGHAWRMRAWKETTGYPVWFVFYGEEEFASFELFKKKWQIHYLPDVLVHHRVSVRDRKKDPDFYERLRRSIRAGWYNYFLFVPVRAIPRKFLYSFWMQLKLKVFKGEVKVIKVLLLALGDLLLNYPKIKKRSNRLSVEEYGEYMKLAEAKIYWNPDE